MSTGMAEVSAERKHSAYRWFGPRQGTQCSCGDMFYPDSQDGASIKHAWRVHVFEASGCWPEELVARTPDPLAAAMNDEEGRALVQAIHHRKAAA